MKGIALTATLLLGGCAGSPPTTTAIPLAAAQSFGAAPVVAEPTEVREVNLQSLPKEEPRTTPCRKEAPTGSRIAVVRCDRARSTAERELDEYVLEKGLEHMRQQALYEYERQAREAMRQPSR